MAVNTQDENRMARSRGRGSRRTAIVAVAAELFEAKGFEAASVNEIAERLGMSVGGLYRYITTKSDLLTMVCEDIYGDLPDVLRRLANDAGASSTRLLQVCETYLAGCDANRALILLMYREYRHLPASAQARFKQRELDIVATLADLIVQAQNATASAPGADPFTLAQDIVFLGHLPALKGWSLPRVHVSNNSLVAQQLAVFRAVLGLPADEVASRAAGRPRPARWNRSA